MLINVTFSGNAADYGGGGLYNYYYSSPILNNVDFVNNMAGQYGGGVFNQDNSSPEMLNCSFTDNIAIYGGGMYNSTDSNPTLTNVTFISNSATNFGGGIHNYSSSPTLTDVTVSGNTASYGGGMENEWYSDPTLTDVTFTGNSAVWGGGMSNDDYSNPTLTDVTFTNNSADSDGGGGMHNTDSSPTLMNVTFTNNSGGGMGNQYSSPILMNVIFSDNSANSGGGMGNWGSSPTLLNVTFDGNTAINAGGGMYNNLSSNPNLTNVTFTGNSANDRGGGIAHDNSDLMLTNVTFSGNTAINSGGGMDISSSSAQVRNSIFWGNTAANGTQIYNSSSTLILSDDVIQGGCPAGSNCTNIISADPLLGTLGDYGGFTQTIPLQADSSAIDTGNDTVCPTTDQRGITRPQGTHCDIGAYEYVDTSAPTVTSITRLNSSPTNLASVGFTVTFSESVTGVDTGDFALNTSGVTGASITGVSGGATAYTITINTGTGNGTIRLDVPISASINDLSGNPLTGLPYTSGDSYTIDKTAPAVAMTSPAADPTNASPIAVSVTFSESVTGFTSTEIVPTNGTVSNFTGSGASYTFDLIPAGQGLVKADIAAGVATDSAGNGNTVASQFSRLYDTIAPTVLSSLRANPNPTNLASVTFTVTFSEPVTGVNVSDFSLAITGISGAFVSGVSGSGSVYTVTVNTGSGTGTIRLDVVDNDSIVDLACNSLGGAGAGNGSYSSGESYDVRFYLIYLPLIIK